MEKTPGRGCAVPTAAALGLVFVCAGIPYIWFVRDYDYIEQTGHRIQDAGVLAAQALSWGLVGLLVILGGYALAGLIIASAGGWTRWASPAARAVYEAIELKRADHLELPNAIQTYTVTHNYNQRQAVPAELPPAPIVEGSLAPAALPPPQAEAFETSSSRLEQLAQRGHIARSDGQILVGYAGQQPLYMRAAEWGLGIIVGQSGKGKSSLAGLIIAQAALAGWAIIVCDPVYHREERSLLKDFLAGLTGAIWKQAVTPEEIAAAVATAMSIANKRLTTGVNGARVLLVVDEFSTVAGRKMLDSDQMEELFLTATKASAVGVHTLLIAHDLSGSWFGGQAARRGRDQATHRLICNMSPAAAAPILPNQAYAQQVGVLPVGQALFFDGWQEPSLASFPKLSPQDLAWAARGEAPKPYAPWTSRAMPTAPAEGEVIPAASAPSAKIAPPTENLSIKAADLILDTLEGSRLELDVKEIARRTRLGESTVSSALAELRAEGEVTHRRDGRRFVYSVSSGAAGD